MCDIWLVNGFFDGILLTPKLRPLKNPTSQNLQNQITMNDEDQKGGYYITNYFN